jgi:hypothetical protein
VAITREQVTGAVIAQMDDASVKEALSTLMLRTFRDGLGGVLVKPLISAQVQKPMHQSDKPFSARLSLLATVKYITLLLPPLLDDNFLKHMMPAHCMLLGHHMANRRGNVEHVNWTRLSP